MMMTGTTADAIKSRVKVRAQPEECDRYRCSSPVEGVILWGWSRMTQWGEVQDVEYLCAPCFAARAG